MQHDIVKAIEKAFAFHPYGQPKPSVYGSWVMGPTFIVKVEDTTNLAFAHLSNLWVTNTTNEQSKLEAVLEKESEADLDISLCQGKHKATPKCTYRSFTGAGNKFGLEVGYPLASLGKKAGVTSWKTINNDVGVLTFGYNNKDEFVCILIGRRVGLDHEES